MSTFTITLNTRTTTTIVVKWDGSGSTGDYRYSVSDTLGAGTTGGSFIEGTNLVSSDAERVGTIAGLNAGTQYDVTVTEIDAAALPIATSNILRAYTAFVAYLAALDVGSISIAWPPLVGVTGSVTSFSYLASVNNEAGVTGAWTLSQITKVGGRTLARDYDMGTIQEIFSWNTLVAIAVSALNGGDLLTLADSYPQPLCTSSFVKSVTKITNSSFDVSWTPFNNTELYVCLYTPNGVFDFNNPSSVQQIYLDPATLSTLPNGDLVGNVPGLIPGTEYLVFILAFNGGNIEDIIGISQTFRVSTTTAVEDYSPFVISRLQYAYRRRLLWLKRHGWV